MPLRPILNALIYAALAVASVSAMYGAFLVAFEAAGGL